MPAISSVALPLSELLCAVCEKDSAAPRDRAFVASHPTVVEIPDEGGGPVQVTLDVHKVTWRLDGKGRYVALAEMRLPCPGCGKDHKFNHLMEAPLIFLRNLRKCAACGGEYRLEDENIDYSEPREGEPHIEVSAKLVCHRCAAHEHAHWDVPSPEVTTLRGAKEVEVDLSGSTVYPRKPSGGFKHRFDVALSFPGTRRAFVLDVALALTNTYPRDRVFYDEFYKEELARPGLDVYLQNIYKKNALLVVVFLCGDYHRSEWCGLEWRSVREVIKSKAERSIMVMRFDEVEIPGLLTIDGYLNLNQA